MDPPRNILSRYPKDARALETDRQFMWGPALLISPVLTEVSAVGPIFHTQRRTRTHMHEHARTNTHAHASTCIIYLCFAIQVWLVKERTGLPGGNNKQIYLQLHRVGFTCTVHTSI